MFIIIIVIIIVIIDANDKIPWVVVVFINSCYVNVIIIIILKLQEKVALHSHAMHVRPHVHIPESSLCTR